MTKHLFFPHEKKLIFSQCSHETNQNCRFRVLCYISCDMQNKLYILKLMPLRWTWWFTHPLQKAHKGCNSTVEIVIDSKAKKPRSYVYFASIKGSIIAGSCLPLGSNPTLHIKDNSRTTDWIVATIDMHLSTYCCIHTIIDCSSTYSNCVKSIISQHF